MVLSSSPVAQYSRWRDTHTHTHTHTRWRDTRLFMSLLSPLSSLIACHKFYSLSRLKEFQIPKCTPLLLASAPLSMWFSLPGSPFSSSSKLLSCFRTHFRCSVILWALSHRVMSSLYTHHHHLEFSFDKQFTSIYISISTSISSLHFSLSL